MFAGSKSEGAYAFLRVSDDLEYCLMRRDVYHVNDYALAAYDGMTVDVMGEIVDGWVIADSIVNTMAVSEGPVTPCLTDEIPDRDQEEGQKTENDEQDL